MTREELLRKLEAARLGPHIVRLSKVIGACIEIETEVEGDERLAIGESKIGGWPDLSAGIEWPHVAGRALPFIGQFRLDDVARVLPGCGLPDSGLLSIFFDGDFSAYDDARRLDRCCVIHHAGALQRTPPPCEPNDEFVLRACAAYLEPSVTLPPVEEVYIDGELPTIPAVTPIFDKSSHRSGYIRVRKKLRTLGHRLLGHPDELQGGELKLDLVRRLDRKDRFRYVDYEWTNLDELVAEMRRWRLLCQIATDPEAQMSWGDGGIVYLWIRDDDLRTGRFDRVHAEMQW